jgi:flavin reductase (DIM6/NTAB) family NADH-FMN oxidoreductase RutF
MDKAKEFGFSYVAGETVNVPAVKEYPLVLECKVVYKQLQDEKAIAPDDLEKFYPKDESGKRDIHMAYTAEITKAYILE